MNHDEFVEVAKNQINQSQLKVEKIAFDRKRNTEDFFSRGVSTNGNGQTHSDYESDLAFRQLI